MPCRMSLSFSTKLSYGGEFYYGAHPHACFKYLRYLEFIGDWWIRKHFPVLTNESILIVSFNLLLICTYFNVI